MFAAGVMKEPSEVSEQEDDGIKMLKAVLRTTVHTGRRGSARQCSSSATREGGADSEAHEARWA